MMLLSNRKDAGNDLDRIEPGPKKKKKLYRILHFYMEDFDGGHIPRLNVMIVQAGWRAHFADDDINFLSDILP